MTVLLVVTEHSSRLTPSATARYEEARLQLAAKAGSGVECVHYEEVDGLTGADAVVLSGSHAPWALHDPAALRRLGEHVLSFDGPVLGICAGMQLQALFAGGSVRHAAAPCGPGYRPVEVMDDEGLLAGMPATAQVYQHHTDEIAVLPDGFLVLARSEDCFVEAVAAPARGWWGTQFHPELASPEHPEGGRVLANFFALAGLRAGRER